MTKRIGLIGLGDIAQKVYLPLLSGDTSVEIKGVMSTTMATVERTLHKYRLPFGTTQLDQLLALDLDAVFVHSPTESHYDIVMACLARGVAVYVDKPLSYNWSQCVEMASQAEKMGVLLGVGFNRRFAPLYVGAKTWLEQVGGFDWCMAAKQRVKQQSLSAAQTVYDDLIHMLDLLLWLGGDSYELMNNQQQIDADGKLVHTAGMLSFGKAAGAYSMVRRAGTDLEKLELHGNGRSVEVNNLETAIMYEKGTLPKSRVFGSWDSILYRRGFAGVVDHFLQSLDQPEPCQIRADQVLETHRLAEQLANMA